MAYDEDLADRLRDHLAGEPGLTEKRMFGGVGFMIGGHMAVGVSNQGGLLVRCDPSDTDALLGEAYVKPFVMRDRPMTGWLRVGAGGAADEEELARWADLGAAYARSLPPK